MGKIITVLAMLFVMSSFVKAQTWESCTNGLEGKSIKTLAVIGQRIFAGTGCGWVFVTYDNGENWIPLDSIPAKPTVFAPYKDDILMGTYSSGMMQSFNGGTVWVPLNKDTLEKGVRIIEVVGDNLFIFTEGPDKERAYGRISRSTDGGETWTPVLTGKSYNWLYSLTSIGSMIFVSTSQGDVYRSDNFGANWTNVGIDLPDKNIYTIKAQGNNLLAGSEEGRFFISSDLGETWRNANKGFPDDWVSAITSSKQNIFVGTNESGVYLSTDNGDSWNDFSDTLWNHHIQNGCLIVKDEYIFFSTGGNNGLYRKDISALINPVNDESNQGFEVSPNPANDFITITLERCATPPRCGTSGEVNIYNTLGEMVLSESNHPMTASHRMNLESLPKGMYFVRNGDKVIKFTKN